MRGGDKRTGELFSYADLEKRVGSGHPLRAIRGLVRGADRAGARILCALCADWAAVDAAGEAAPSDAVAGVLFDPVGTAADGAAWSTIFYSAGSSESGSMLPCGTIRCS